MPVKTNVNMFSLCVFSKRMLNASGNNLRIWWRFGCICMLVSTCASSWFISVKTFQYTSKRKLPFWNANERRTSVSCVLCGRVKSNNDWSTCQIQSLDLWPVFPLCVKQTAWIFKFSFFFWEWKMCLGSMNLHEQVLGSF